MSPGRQVYQTFKDKALQDPSVLAVSGTSSVPGGLIGVVNDFHAKSLHQKIEPLLIHIAPNPDAFIQLIMRIAPYNYDKTLNFIEDVWKEVYPRDPFVYSFLDDDYDNLYRTEKQRGKVFLAFSVLAIFIACLGLFGLASFTSEQKTKEIGIRKVLGATVGNIVRLLSKEFLELVLLANLIAWPVSYYIMHNWLGNFAYRTNINIGTFVVVGVVALIIALVTVSFHAVKSALANPAGSIRTE